MTAEIYPIKVIRTLEYSPECYLEYCEEYGEEPTQDGFLTFLEDGINEDFSNQNGEQTIEVLK